MIGISFQAWGGPVSLQQVTAVVYEYRDLAGDHIVRVDVVDGEVVGLVQPVLPLCPTRARAPRSSCRNGDRLLTTGAANTGDLATTQEGVVAMETARVRPVLPD